MSENKHELFIEPIDVGVIYLSPDEAQEITHVHIKLSKPFPKKDAKKLVNRWLSQPKLLEACKAMDIYFGGMSDDSSLDEPARDAVMRNRAAIVEAEKGRSI